MAGRAGSRYSPPTRDSDGPGMGVEQDVGLTPEETSFGAHASAAAPPSGALPYRSRRCRHGTFIYNTRDRFIGRSLDLYGEYAELELQLLLRLIKPGDIVVDAGASIGAFSVPMARRVGPDGWVLAAEPQRLVHQMLCANVAVNGLANVVAHWCGLGAAPGEAVVPPLDHGQEHNYGGIGLRAGGAGERVPVVSVDSLDLPGCALIKVDVEGMELDVLRGAADTIRRRQPRLFVENNGTERSPPLIGWLLEQGYRLYWHVTPLFNPRNFANAAEDAFANLNATNMLCLPPRDTSEVRGLRAVSGPEDTALESQRRRREAAAAARS
ncbi:MAG: FkbM family methyltransferase [Alphaproteobacteria bacterium]|nr:FkbM family methyltransferase [Alphaproteobacteria bacterium]